MCRGNKNNLLIHKYMYFNTDTATLSGQQKATAWSL